VEHRIEQENRITLCKQSFSFPQKEFTCAVNKVKPSQRKWKPKTDIGNYKLNCIQHLCVS